MKSKIPQAFYNRMSYIGLSIAVVSFALIIFLVLLDNFSTQSKPYYGIFAFLLFPGAMIFGLVLLFWGGYRMQKKIQNGHAHIPLLPKIDLNDPRQRRATIRFGLFALFFVSISAFGSYEAYEYSDSDMFCGEICHQVMEPEYTAYQSSPHARVGCAQCHIGSGADWFVKAKISGSYQVYSVLFNKYARPIGTPIENLRPAQQTCEKCHWPSHFYSEMLMSNTYYLSDEKNSKWHLDLLIKVGGGNAEAGPTEGIHWSMNIANEITYATIDPKRQVIPWVQSKDRSGHIRIYRSIDAPLTEEQLKTAQIRRMDCIDCHNRPSHIYHPPARSVNHVMAQNWISPSIPFAKSISIKALDTPYETKEAGLDSIRIMTQEYYATHFPELSVSMKPQITRMVEELQKIYERNYFPYMKASWKNYPNNIGHMYYNGCFRCHDGRHRSDDGKVLSKDCNICHTILSQEYEGQEARSSIKGLEYKHPVEIGDALHQMNCSECHTRK